MEDEVARKSREVNDSYKKFKSNVETLETKIQKLTEEADKIRQTQTKIIKELANENVKIEAKKEERDLLIHQNFNKTEGSNIDNDIMILTCKNMVDNFIGKVGNSYGALQNLFINIKSGSVVITKKLEDPQMTFGMLKKEVALQFNKPFEEIYFADENNNIMLNTMIVKNILFPLDNISLKDYIPLIKIVDPKNQDEASKEEIKKEDNKGLAKDLARSAEGIGFFEKLTKYFRSNAYYFIHFFFLIIFIFLFIISTCHFQNFNEKEIAKLTFQGYISNHFSKQITKDNLISNFQDSVVDFFGFPSSHDSTISNDVTTLSLFSRLNINIGEAKLLQKLGTQSNCTLKLNNSTKTCFDFTQEVTTDIVQGSKSIMNYTSSTSNTKSQGIISTFDRSGFIKYINLKDAPDFYASIKDLTDNEWISSQNIFFSFTINFYNINMDSFMIFTQSYQRIVNNYQPYSNISIIKLSTIFDGLAIAALLFAFFTLLTSIIMILRPFDTKEEVRIALMKEYDKYLNFNKKSKFEPEDNVIVFFFQKRVYQIFFYLRLHFIKPNFYLALTFLNIILSFICLFMRASFLAQVNGIDFGNSDIRIYDLEVYDDQMNRITGLSCFVILLFSFEVMKILYYFSMDSRVIFDALFHYIKKIFSVTVAITIPFMAITVVFTYFMFGDYSQGYYSRFDFHIAKTLSSIFRGMIDNTDYDPLMNFYRFGNVNAKDNGYVGYLNFIKDSNSEIIDFGNKSETLPYFIYACIFYILVRILLMGYHISMYYITYKEKKRIMELEEQKKLKLNKLK